MEVFRLMLAWENEEEETTIQRGSGFNQGLTSRLNIKLMERLIENSVQVMQNKKRRIFLKIVKNQHCKRSSSQAD